MTLHSHCRVMASPPLISASVRRHQPADPAWKEPGRSLQGACKEPARSDDGEGTLTPGFNHLAPDSTTLLVPFGSAPTLGRPCLQVAPCLPCSRLLITVVLPAAGGGCAPLAARLFAGPVRPRLSLPARSSCSASSLLASLLLASLLLAASIHNPLIDRISPTILCFVTATHSSSACQ